MKLQERIRELAKKADASAAVAAGHGTIQPGLRDEYFAKLVARECANIYEAIDTGCTIEGTDDFLEALYRSFK